MKTTTLLSAAALALGSLAAAGLDAQTAALQLNDADLEVDGRPYRGTSVLLAAEPDRGKDALEDWADDEYDVDFDYKGSFPLRDKDYLVADDVRLALLGDAPSKLVARVVESGEGTMVTMYSTDLNDAGYTTTSNAAAYNGTRMFLDRFLEDFVPEYYRERVATVESTIEELREDVDDFREQIRDNEAEIEELRAENVELEQNIETARLKLEEAGVKLDDREDELRDAVRKVNADH